jgi:hypothetical protein
MLPTPALAAPDKLSDMELDLVTAGVSAAVAAGALASGSIAVTGTDSATRALAGPVVSAAVGRGRAGATGSDGALTDVDVAGEGGRVSTKTGTVSSGTPKGTTSYSWGLVVAFKVNHKAVTAAPR